MATYASEITGSVGETTATIRVRQRTTAIYKVRRAYRSIPHAYICVRVCTHEGTMQPMQHTLGCRVSQPILAHGCIARERDITAAPTHLPRLWRGTRTQPTSDGDVVARFVLFIVPSSVRPDRVGECVSLIHDARALRTAENVQAFGKKVQSFHSDGSGVWTNSATVHRAGL